MGRLTAARDALDAEQAQRRRREEAAFGRYAEAAARAETIAGERDAELARLDTERDRARERARERLAEGEAVQRAVLAELNTGGRSAEELATLFELPIKRVRTLLRAAKTATPDSSGSDGSGRPAGQAGKQRPPAAPPPAAAAGAGDLAATEVSGRPDTSADAPAAETAGRADTSAPAG